MSSLRRCGPTVPEPCGCRLPARAARRRVAVFKQMGGERMRSVWQRVGFTIPAFSRASFIAFCMTDS